MVIKFLLDIVVSVVNVALSGLSLLSLPVDLISAFATCIEYGQYFLGDDLFLLVLSTAVFWIGLKATAGVILFIWRLLPLT